MIQLQRLADDGKSFGHYWRAQFRTDLSRILNAAAPYADHDPLRTVQPWRLGPRNPVVRRWPRASRERFATALFVMLQLDGFAAGYRSNRYEEFDARFGAPKFIGDCPGGCILDLEPSCALFCLGEGPARWQDRVPVIPDRDLEPDVRGIAHAVCAELRPDQDADSFAAAFVVGWLPPLMLVELANEAERNRRGVPSVEL